LPEDIESEVKELSQVSMGTEVSEADMLNICELCQQVIDITQYREQLWDYLRSRMSAIAPNLSTLVGELVGARLIAHTGSLISLAKYPASTIQILGAEKALFRALKTKKKTPKYGLIYHASLIGQAPTKGKGQISRVLAAKAALCARVDALAETTSLLVPAATVDKTEKIEKAKAGAEAATAPAEEAVSTMVGTEGRAKVEMRIRVLEGKQMRAVTPPKKTSGKPQKYDYKHQAGMARATQSFVTAHDIVLVPTKAKKEATTAETSKKRKLEPESYTSATVKPEAEEVIPKKKKAKKPVDEEDSEDQ